MFSKLQHRWKVNGTQLFLILCTFAAGGSACGYIGRKILLLTGLEKGAAWILLYIIIMTLLWPLCVILISIPLGQFSFFKNYLAKIWSRIKGKRKKIRKVAVFASGAGSNAQQIIHYFRNDTAVEIALIVCNKPQAGVLQIAAEEKIASLLIQKKRFLEEDAYLPELKKAGIDFIVLAGFLWKVPAKLIAAYPGNIVNIHPALLPKYGGLGMYGAKVHEAVVAAGEKQSGITIHYVDEMYDHGQIIYQASCDIEQTDTPASLAEKIHMLEHQHYPATIARLLHK